MPRNNKRTNKEIKPEQLSVGEHPKAEAPNVIAQKGLQDALVDGYNSVSSFARDFLDVEPYEKQAEVLDAARDCVEFNFSAGNRVGKTFASGVWLLWKAFYRHHNSHTDIVNRTKWNTYKAVNCSLTFDQSKLAWTYAYNFASSSKRFKPFLADTVHSPFPKMTLRTRDEDGNWVPSEIHARSLAKNGLYLLGMSINHLQVDECAYVPKYLQIQDEVLRMRLADTGGSLFRISTPNGRNFFFAEYQKGERGDPRHISKTLTTWDNPYVSRSYIEGLKSTMIPEYYAQNVLGAFVSLSDVFPLEWIERLYTRETSDGIEPVEYTLEVPPDRKGRYLMGADLGARRDPTAVIVWRIDTNPIQTVFVDEIKGQGWRAGREYIKSVYYRYRPEFTYVDATGGGGPIVQDLIDEDQLDGVAPFVFSHTSKPQAIAELQDSIQQRIFELPLNQKTQDLIHQLSFYRLDDKDIKQDWVMTLALVNQAYKEWEKRNRIQTEIFEDLSFIDVRRGGEMVAGADVFGPGTLFRLDENGLFVPNGYGEIDSDAFIL